MAYVKQTWATGETITAEKLNHMELGIFSNSFSPIVARRREDTSGSIFYDLYGVEWDGETANQILLTPSNIASFWPTGGVIPYIVATRTDELEPFNAFPVLYVEVDPDTSTVTMIVCAAHNEWDEANTGSAVFSWDGTHYTWAALDVQE